MTTNITELALIAKIKKQTENFDTVVLKEWEALALVEALEKAQETIAFQQGEIKALLLSLESRTVKLLELFELSGLSGGSSYYHADEVDAALIAAGIKVEAE